MFSRLFLAMTVVFGGGPILLSQKPEARDKPVVELRWLERTPIKGVTEDKGIQGSDAEDDLLYPHKKPALVLTKKEVAEAKITKHDFTKSGLGVNYMVSLHLTKEARAKLAEGLTGKESRKITVTVDGKHIGWKWYVIDKNKQVSDEIRAETFLPEVGFFTSEAEAKRLADAFK